MIKRQPQQMAMTAPHAFVSKLLNKHGINHENEVPHGKYRMDIYVPEWRVCIEIDGRYHSRLKDEVRDASLREDGILTLRIPAVDCTKKNADALFERIVTFLEAGK